MIENIAIMLTDACNLNCYHCFRSVDNKRHPINVDLYRQLSKVMIVDPKCKVRFTGGEPLLCTDITELIRTFSENGFSTSLGTNATLLNSDNICKFKTLSLGEIWTSIHSFDAHRHDSLAGKKGSFQLTVNAIKLCQKQKIKICLNFPVSRYNIEDAIETLLYLDDLGVDRIKLLRITPLGKARAEAFEHIGDVEWLKLYESVKQLSFKNSDFKMQGCYPVNKNEGQCTVFPLKHLNFSPNGYVYPCCLLNNRSGMEIGHVSELLEGNWDDVIALFNKRAQKKYNLNKNPIPCVDTKLNVKICPLFSKSID